MVTDTGRRIHAAQAYGGFSSIAALAAKINRPGFGEGTIRRIVAGSRPLEDHERAWLEDATGVPAAFFQDGFAAPRGEPADDAEITTERLDELVREMTDYLKIQADLNTAKITARLDRIDERLGQLKQRDKDVEDAVAQIRAFAEAGASSTPQPVTPLPRKGSRRGKTRKAAGPGPDGPQR